VQVNDNALAAMPEDFSAFEAWRNTGEAPEASESETPGAAAEQPAESAESADESGTSEEEAQSDEQKSESEETPKPKHKGGFQKRISQLTREKQELQERLARFEAGQAGGTNAAAPQAEAKSDGKPDQSKFNTWEEYNEALTDWKVEQKLQAKEAEAQRQAAEYRQQQLVSSWAQRENAVREKVADYDDVMESAADVPVSAAVRDMLLESDHGPQLAYWLAKNTDVARQIANLDDKSAARAIGRIEAAFLTSSEQTKKPAPKASAAPPPIKPVGQKGGRVYDPLAADMDYDAWEKGRNAQLRSR
jgi:hypothetical protein